VIKQFFRYGILRINVVKKHPDAFKMLHGIPPTFVLSIIATLLLGLTNPVFLKAHGGIWGLYFTYNLIASLSVSMKIGLKYLLVLPIIFLSMHFGFGVGFLVGIFKTSR